MLKSDSGLATLAALALTSSALQAQTDTPVGGTSNSTASTSAATNLNHSVSERPAGYFEFKGDWSTWLERNNKTSHFTNDLAVITNALRAFDQAIHFLPVEQVEKVKKEFVNLRIPGCGGTNSVTHSVQSDGVYQFSFKYPINTTNFNSELAMATIESTSPILKATRLAGLVSGSQYSVDRRWSEGHTNEYLEINLSMRAPASALQFQPTLAEAPGQLSTDGRLRTLLDGYRAARDLPASDPGQFLEAAYQSILSATATNLTTTNNASLTNSTSAEVTTALGNIQTGVNVKAYHTGLAAKLSNLSDLYANNSEYGLAAICQSLAIRLQPATSTEFLRRFGERYAMAPEVKNWPLPGELKAQLAEHHELTKFVPSLTAAAAAAKMVENVPIADHIRLIFRVESRLGAATENECEQATTQLLAVYNQVHRQFAKQDQVSALEAAEAATAAIQQHAQSQYRPLLDIQGVASRLACRMTDCSSRVFLAITALWPLEMTDKVKLEQVEISPEGMGPNVLAHTYLKITDQAGKIVFLDPSRFELGGHIQEGVHGHEFFDRYYTGNNPKIKLKSSSNPLNQNEVQLAYNHLTEHVLEEMRTYLPALVKSGLERDDFLFRHREFIAADRTLRILGQAFVDTGADKPGPLTAMANGSSADIKKHFIDWLKRNDLIQE